MIDLRDRIVFKIVLGFLEVYSKLLQTMPNGIAWALCSLARDLSLAQIPARWFTTDTILRTKDRGEPASDIDGERITR